MANEQSEGREDRKEIIEYASRSQMLNVRHRPTIFSNDNALMCR